MDFDVVGPYDEVRDYARKNKFNDGQIFPAAGGRKMVYMGSRGILEAEIAWPDSLTEELYRLISDDCHTYEGRAHLIPSIDVLYMLKMSHRYLRNSPHFLKTMRDIHELRRMGAKIRPEHEEFYARRMLDTYDYKHPSLMRNKEQFFSGDGVQYVYDHDSIHEAVAYPLVPAYRLYARDDHDVMSSREKFFAVDEATRLRGVIEEATVLALERSQIPFPGGMTPEQSFRMALMKVCTSITSGWFREYAWEHYDQAIAGYDPYYLGKFTFAVRQGRVKPA